NCPVNTYLVDVGDSESEPECRPCPTNSVSAGGQATTCTCSEGYTASYLTNAEHNADNLMCCPMAEVGTDRNNSSFTAGNTSVQTIVVRDGSSLKCACPSGYASRYYNSNNSYAGTSFVLGSTLKCVVQIQANNTFPQNINPNDLSANTQIP
ncbi:MAG: hypothetical protein IKF41_02145, partial [Alphaproteobacteria bacterium]|nr:hypothetical protein [Alphaproteobacteria bacterium]